MLNIGMIGAGAISDKHLTAYSKNEQCKLVAISDVNEALAKEKAEVYTIEKVYTDYRDLLNDKDIDAVSVATPTFTHKDIIIEALNAGKHVLCEKPPARNASEVREIKEAAEKSNKCLMFGFLTRFGADLLYVKDYIDSGKMGKLLCAETARISRCSGRNGWFVNKEKSGGGALIDGNIHEIDGVLYLMGYPKPKAVMGFTSDMNADLPSRMYKDGFRGWNSKDLNTYKADVETFATAFVTFENDTCLTIKTSTVLNSVTTGAYFELSGENASARIQKFIPEKELVMLEVTEDDTQREFVPELKTIGKWGAQINHFVDCCLNGTECITKIDEALRLMEIIDAIYKSAETKMPVIF